MMAPRDADDLDATAFVVYTSGTTGRAKGVMLTQRSMLRVNAACWVPIAGLSGEDHVLSPLPLFHSYALNVSVLAILATGARESIMDRFSTTAVAARLGRGGFTVRPGVPTMFHDLLDGSRAAGSRDAGSLVPVGRRHAARSAEPRFRGLVRRSPAGRLRHHRDLHHGHDERTDRHPDHGLLWPAAARAGGAAGRSRQRRRCRAGDGIPHHHLGEVPVAFVVPRAGPALDPQALLAHCRARLSAYKIPHAIEIVAEIPRTGSGKVMRFRLREALGDRFR